MPSGRTHDRLTWLLLPGVAAIAYGVTRSGGLTLAVSGAFLFSGLMFGPDLDIHSVQYKRWGWLRWLWLPYRKMLRHRSLISHGFLVGTFFRLFYVAICFTAIAFLLIGFTIIIQLPWRWDLLQIWLTISSFLKSHSKEAIALLIGLEVGAMSHSLSDWLGSAIKRYLKSAKKTRKRQSTQKRVTNKPHKRSSS
ncbi:MAG: metal-binding protein [Microcystaceae cyanobacterium]